MPTPSSADPSVAGLERQTERTDMSTNDTVAKNDTEVEELQETETTQDDETLRQELKNSIANDTKTEVKETETVPNAETAEVTAEAQAEPEATFTKEVPSIPGQTPEEYYKNLATAYQESTKEAMRLKGELDKTIEAPPAPTISTEIAEAPATTPEQLYIKQMLLKESDEAFAETVNKYPQVKDPDTYKRFTETAKILSQTIVTAEQRFPLAKELYEKTAVVLGLKPDNSEAISAAVKAGAETPRTSSGTPTIPPKSKVTEEMISLNLKMYPNKSRAEIIEELEPHIN